MIKSMTGYGKSTCELNGKKYTVEIKSLNSKSLDINLRIPHYFKEKEIIIRNEISKTLQRGKIDVYIEQESFEDEGNTAINLDIAKSYYKQITQLQQELNIPSVNVIETIMRMPDVLKRVKNELNEDEWSAIFVELQKAIALMDNYRIQEGEVLQQDISKRINLILAKSDSIVPFDKQRITTIKERIQKALEDTIGKDAVDHNRFEQEIIFYLEKLDITEEKVRLRNNCNYFLETLQNEEGAGKKLGFIAQEILREINTTGSKANDSTIQMIVVEMKDETEKIKEQLMNVL